MSFICIPVQVNLIKAHGGKGSGPFSFERLATSPPQADHILVVLFFFNGGPGGCVKAPQQNINPNAIKVLEENFGRKISDIPNSNILRDMSPKARDIKERMRKWDFIKIKSFCMAKENSTKLQRDPTVWENIFANDTSDKGLISKIYHELT